MAAPAEASAILTELEDLRNTEYVDGYLMAFVYDALCRQDEAFQELERAGVEGSPYLFMMDIDPRMDCLRGHPPFHAAAQQDFPLHRGRRHFAVRQ